MNSIRWIKPGLACVEPGVKMSVFDKQARETGWELRMVPSTYRTATIGGFIGRGSGGIGSITYGQLRDGEIFMPLSRYNGRRAPRHRIARR